MRKIAMKYPLDPESIEMGKEFMVELPVKAEVLTAHTVREIPIIYALVREGEKTTEQRRFIVYNTGMSFEVRANHVYDHHGTFVLGNDILHLFEVIRIPAEAKL